MSKLPTTSADTCEITGETCGNGTVWDVVLADGHTFEVETSGGWMEVRAYWTSHEGEARKMRAPVGNPDDPSWTWTPATGAAAQRAAVRYAAREIASDWRSLGGSGTVVAIAARGATAPHGPRFSH